MIRDFDVLVVGECRGNRRSVWAIVRSALYATMKMSRRGRGAPGMIESVVTNPAPTCIVDALLAQAGVE